ncbi:MAG TPA: carotenoid biosynthesis protein, partial [Euzebyales bacterium]|nr:carotenoid biosynthesis protein [Euzebyales bacterium]
MRRRLPVGLAVAVVALQIAYPLVTPGPARDRLTVAIVLVFAAASLTHALVWRGVRFAATLFVTTALGGLLIEAVGVSTGVPFGQYRYGDSLGVAVLGVPVVVALAWMMMAYPAYTVSEVLDGGRMRRALAGGWALAAWDLFLDPQMVREGHWQWRDTGPDL